jgi:hypothetical protein
MKKLILISIITFLPLILSAQFCGQNTNTTDWRQYPTNSNNNFDWSAPFFNNVFISGTNVATGVAYPQPTSIASPFWSTSSSVSQTNVATFQFNQNIHGINGVDIWPEDGWELLFKDFGTPSAPVTNPTFILYNRFTADMRIFVLITNSPNITGLVDAGNILISNPVLISGTKQNAILSFTNPEISALDKFVPDLKPATANSYTTGEDFWLYMDMQAAYDPCICRYTTQEKMQIDVDILSAGHIVLQGKATGTSQDIYNSTNSSNPVPGNNLGFMSILNESSVVANTLIKGLAATNSTDQAVQGIKDAASQQNVKAPKISQMQNEADGFNLWGAIASATPYVGTVVGIIDFLSTGGKTTTSVNAKPTPVIWKTETDYDFTGTMTTASKQPAKAFYMPGAYSNPTNPLTPIYNNVLGTFNLLETPQFQFVEYTPASDIPLASQTNIREYKLTKDIKYVVNPASGLVVKSITAAVVYNQPNLPSDVDTTNYPIKLRGPVEFGADKILRFSSGYSFEDRFENDGVQIESWPKNFKTLKDITFRNPYVPLACLSDNSHFFILHKDASDDPNIFVKLIVILSRTDAFARQNPDKVQDAMLILKYKANATQINASGLTYDCHDYDQGYTFIPSEFTTIVQEGGNINVPEFSMSPSPFPDPQGKNNGSVNINSSNQSAYFQNPLNTNKILSAYDIHINDGVTIPAGWQLLAGHSIVIDHSVLLNNLPFSAKISTSPAACESIPVSNFKALDQDVSAYCSSQAYDQLANSQQPVHIDSDIPDIKAAKDFNVYPNPLTDNGIIEYSISEPGIVSITISDMLGHEVDEPLNANYQLSGTHRVDFDASGLNPGVYHVSIHTSTYTSTKEVVVVTK